MISDKTILVNRIELSGRYRKILDGYYIVLLNKDYMVLIFNLKEPQQYKNTSREFISEVLTVNMQEWSVVNHHIFAQKINERLIQTEQNIFESNIKILCLDIKRHLESSNVNPIEYAKLEKARPAALPDFKLGELDKAKWAAKGSDYFGAEQKRTD